MKERKPNACVLNLSNHRCPSICQVLQGVHEKQIKLQQWQADIRVREQRVHAAEQEIERQRAAIDSVLSPFQA